MYRDGKIYFGNDDSGEVHLELKMANRHGLIAGATGTGKTVTLKVLAESFSAAGVPVFLADVKGDLSAMCVEGAPTPHIAETLAAYGMDSQTAHGMHASVNSNPDATISHSAEDLAEFSEGESNAHGPESLSERSIDTPAFQFQSYPTEFWDVYGEGGIPLRATAEGMGPFLLSRVLGLNSTQEGVLNALFRIARDEHRPLIDTEDLRDLLIYANENTDRYSARYGNMAKPSLGAIQRNLLKLESDGGDRFFGVPALDIRDWMRTAEDGRGIINVLDCRKLVLHPTMYATFLLWMLTELYESLPEIGDPEKPRLVFFFDEAHLLFDAATKELKEKVDQVVKLIRSKGVGIYFVTQTPADVPGSVLSQLGNKIQHALRAYTPQEKRGIRTAAESFRPNPSFHTESTLEELGIGEALVSCLDEKGVPGIVRRTRILPPQSALGQVDDGMRDVIIRSSVLYEKYVGGKAAAVGEDGNTAEEDRKRAEEVLERAEEDRKRAEEDRERAVENRERAEEDRERAEENRKRAEEDRKKVEEVRKRSESISNQSDGIHIGDESAQGLRRSRTREEEKEAVRRKLKEADRTGKASVKKVSDVKTVGAKSASEGSYTGNFAPAKKNSDMESMKESPKLENGFYSASDRARGDSSVEAQKAALRRKLAEADRNARNAATDRSSAVPAFEKEKKRQKYPSENDLFGWIRTAFDDHRGSAEEEKDGYTRACEMAADLLAHAAYSRAGLVRLLEAEGFLSREAEYAVEQIGADWYGQARRRAKSLKSEPFVTSGQIRILLESEGFTTDEAEFGASRG